MVVVVVVVVTGLREEDNGEEGKAERGAEREGANVEREAEREVGVGRGWVAGGEEREWRWLLASAQSLREGPERRG